MLTQHFLQLDWHFYVIIAAGLGSGILALALGRILSCEPTEALTDTLSTVSGWIRQLNFHPKSEPGLARRVEEIWR